VTPDAGDRRQQGPPRPRIPCGRLRDGRLLVGLTPALLAALRKHGPQAVSAGAGVELVLVYGTSLDAMADALHARGIVFADAPDATP